MKYFLRIVLLVLLSPLLTGSITPHTPYYPFQQNATLVSNNQTLSLSNDMFGLKGPLSTNLQFTQNQSLNLSNAFGPLSVNIQYSKTFGASLISKYAQLVNENNALAGDIEMGTAQRRFNFTWGHTLTDNQRIKVSGENFGQKLNFDFTTGSTNQWIYQNALGLTYEHLLKNAWFNDVNANAFYSQALSKTLSTQQFTNTTGIYDDYRHIAGGTVKSVSTGTDMAITKTTQLNAQLSYDDLTYNTEYDTAPNKKGIGTSFTLNQLITQRLKIALLASRRPIYDNYQTSFNWLLYDVPGSTLEMDIIGNRILGKSTAQNDTQFNLNLIYQWGGDTLGHPLIYTAFTAAPNEGNLSDWSSTPAVYMQQVMAVKDEKVVQIGDSTPYKSNYQPANMTVNEGDPINLTFYGSADAGNHPDIGLFHDPLQSANSMTLSASFASSDPNVSQMAYTYTATGNDDGILQITGPSTFAEKSIITLTITATNAAGPASQANQQTFTLMISETPAPSITTYPAIIDDDASTDTLIADIGTGNATTAKNANKVIPIIDCSSIRIGAAVENPSIQLSAFNLDQKTDCDPNTPKPVVHVYVTGMPYNTPTYQTYHFPVTANYVTGDSIAPAEGNDRFSLDVTDAPEPITVTPPAIALPAGTPLDIEATHYIQNPSGTTNLQFCLGNDMSICPTQYLDNQITLNSQTGTLTGNIKTTGHYLLPFFAKNNKGIGRIVSLPLDIGQPDAPVCNITPEPMLPNTHNAAWQVNHPIPRPDYSTLSNIVAAPSAQSGNLTVDLSAANTQLAPYHALLNSNCDGSTQTCSVTLDSSQITQTTQSGSLQLPFTLSNGYNTTTCTYALDLGGPPEPKTTPYSQTIRQGDDIRPIDLGTPIGSAFFNNSTGSGALNNMVISNQADLQNQGISVTINGSQITGSISPTAAVKTYPINLIAYNDVGPSSTPFNIVLSVIDRSQPIIHIHQNDHFTDINQATVSHYNFATINSDALEGDQINPAQLTLTINGAAPIPITTAGSPIGHGLSASVIYSNDNTQADLYLDGTFTSATFNNPDTLKINVETTHHQIPDPTLNNIFDLYIAGTPEVINDQQDLGGADITYHPTDLFNTVSPLSTHFKNPTKSGDLQTDFSLSLQTPANDEPNVTQLFALTGNNNQLAGTLAPSSWLGTYKIYVRAKNALGESSIDQSAYYTLIMTAATMPTINTTTLTPPAFARGTSSDQIIANLKANDGTLQTNTILFNGMTINQWNAAPANHLSLAVNTKNCTTGFDACIHLSTNDQAVPTFNNQPASIEISNVENSYGETAEPVSISYDVSGAPIAIPQSVIDEGSFKTGDPLTIPKIAASFSNPSYGNPLTYHLKVKEDPTASVSDVYGIQIAPDGSSIISPGIKNSSQLSEITLQLTASNQYGNSTTPVSYLLHLSQPDAPTVTIYPKNFFSIGDSINQLVIANINPTDGTLQKTIQANPPTGVDLSKYGLMTQVNYIGADVDHPTSAQVVLTTSSGTTAITQSTLNSIPLTISGVTNSYGKTANPAAFSLSIAGAPFVDTSKVNLGTSSAYPADTFTGNIATQNLAANFFNPIDSGNLTFPTSANLRIYKQGSTTDLSSGFGLFIQQNSGHYQLVGAIAPTVSAGTYNLFITASNIQGTSSDAAVYVLTINTAQKPVVTPHDATTIPSPFQVGQTIASPYLVADIQESNPNGTLPNQNTTLRLNGQPLSLWNSENPYGLIATIKQDSPQHDELQLTSADHLSLPTLSTAAIQMTGIINSYGQSADSQIFHFNIGSIPIVNTEDLGGASITYHPGDTFNTLSNLAGYFNNPSGSSTISNFILEENGQHDVEEKYGLSIVNGNLTGAIKPNAPMGHVDIDVYAVNSSGQSSSPAVYQLTISATLAPNTIVSSAPSQTFVEGKSVSPIAIATLQSGEGDLDVSQLQINNVPYQSWSEHGLHAVLQNTNATSAELLLQSNQVSDATLSPKILSITGLQNSHGLSQSSPAHFTLNVAGIPTVKNNLGAGSFKQGEEFIAMTYLALYFNNPTDSGPITHFRLDAPTSDGLAIDDNGNLIGMIPSNAPIGTTTLNIYASNALGESTIAATYNLTILPTNDPHVSINQNDYFIQGNAIDYTLATIKAGDGELQKNTLLINGIPANSWTDDAHGVHTEITYDNNDHPTLATITLKSNDAGAQPTFPNDNTMLTLSGVKNTYGKVQAQPQSFTLAIAAPPSINPPYQNLGGENITYKQGSPFIPVNVLTSGANNRFNNPTKSGDIKTDPTTFKLSIDGKTGIDVSATYGLSVDHQGNLQGVILPNAPATQPGHPAIIQIHVANDIGTSNTYATYALNIQSTAIPSIQITPTTTAFTQGQSNINERIATITAGDGELIKNSIQVSSSPSTHWQTQYGLTTNITYDNDTHPTTAYINLQSNTLINPTLAPETLTISGVQNTLGKSQTTPQTYSLIITGAPFVKTAASDLGGQDIVYRQGQPFSPSTPIGPLADRFNNPMPNYSGNISSFVLSENGKQDVENKFGLSVNGQGELTGTLKNTAPIGTTDIQVQARNAVGLSTDAAVYHLQIRAAIPPTIQIHDVDHFEAGQPLNYNAAIISSGDGSLDQNAAIQINGASLAEWNSSNPYHLTASILWGQSANTSRVKPLFQNLLSTPLNGYTNATLQLTSNNLSTVTLSEVGLTISGFKNTYGDIATPQTFLLKIAGPPQVNTSPDLGGEDTTYLPTDPFTSIDVSTHFDNPLPSISGPISGYLLKDAKDPTLNVTQTYGLSVDAEGHLVGNIPADLQPLTNRLIQVFAVNNKGISTSYAVYHLNIGAPQLPSVINHDATATPPNFKTGQIISHYVMADIYANNGVLTDLSSTLQLSGLSITNWNAQNPYGLTASIENITLQHAQILLTSNSALTTPTYLTAFGQINLTGISNSYHQTAVDRLFTFYIASTPNVKSTYADLGGASTYYHPTDAFTPIQNLASYFDNPTGSGPIKTNFHLTDLDSPSTDVKATYGLSADDGNLSGTIAQGAPYIDHHRIQICAENTIGIAKNCAIYHLTINNADNPNLIIQPIDHLTVGQPLSSTIIATIYAGEGTLDTSAMQINGQSLDIWNQNAPHGLTLTYTPNNDHTAATLALSATQITQATYAQPDTLTITGIKNSYGESQSNAALFSLNVADIPQVDPAQSSLGAGTLKQGQALTTIIGLGAHFKNPIKSGPIDQFSFSADTQSLATTYHLTLDANGNLWGQIPLDAPSTATPGVTLKIIAHNALGWSTTFATYQLTVQTIETPGDSPLDKAIFSRGQENSIAIATIQSIDSPIILDSIKMNGIPVLQWTGHGLTTLLKPNDPTHPTEATVFLEGTPTTSTFQSETITFTGATNVAGKTQTTPLIIPLTIRGAPVINSSTADLGGEDITYTPGQSFNAVNQLADHFSNPTQSGAIHIDQFQVTEPAVSTDPTYVQNTYGIFADSNGNLVGTIKTNAPTTMGSHMFVVQAKNDVAFSDSTESAHYHFNIRAINLPNITINPNDHFDNGATIHYTIANIQANDGVIKNPDQITINNIALSHWNAHGLHAEFIGDDPGNPTTGHLQFVGAITSPTLTEESLTIHGITNSLGAQAEDAIFKLNIAGNPYVDPAQQNVGSATLHPGDSVTPITLNTATLFHNPTKSGTITTLSLSADQIPDVSSTYGLTLTPNASLGTYTLSGAISNTAPISTTPQTIFICAVNAEGTSASPNDCAHYQLTITAVTKPTVQLQPITPNYFIAGQTLSARKIAILNTTDGTLDTSAITINGLSLDDWNQNNSHQLIASIPASEGTTQEKYLYLSSSQALINPTIASETLTIAGLKNSYHESADPQNFTLQIAGAPFVDTGKVNLGTSNAHPGDAFIGNAATHDLAANFLNPIQGGDLTLTTKNNLRLYKQGSTTDLSSHFGLVIQQNNGQYQLAGTIAPTVEAGVYNVWITATNAQGTSADAAIYLLTVTDAQSPDIQTYTYDFLYQQTETFKIADIQANEGTLQQTIAVNGSTTPDTDIAIGNNLNAQIHSISTTHATITISGIPNEPTYTPINVRISGIKNSYDKTAPDATWTLNIEGAPQPVVNPPAQTLYQGETISLDKSLYFKNPTNSGDLSFNSLSTTDGIIIQNNPSNVSQFNITVPATMTSGTKTISLQAINNINPLNPSHNTLNITIAPAISITTTDLQNDLQIGQTPTPGNNTIATIEAYNGTLDLSQATITGTTDGLTPQLTLDAHDPTHRAYVTLTTAPTAPTFSTASLVLSNVRSSNGASISGTTGTFKITGPPLITTDQQRNLGSGTFAPGSTFTPIGDLDQHFSSPIDAGPPSFTNDNLSFIDAQGHLITGNPYGLSIQNNQLMGTLSATAPVGTVTVRISATNNKGISTLYPDNQAFAIYTLTIGNKPTVTASTAQTFTIDKSIDNVEIATVLPGSGAFDCSSTPIIISKPSIDGLTAAVNCTPTSASIILNGTPTTITTAPQTLNISATNNLGLSITNQSSGEFSVNNPAAPAITPSTGSPVFVTGKTDSFQIATVQGMFDDPQNEIKTIGDLHGLTMTISPVSNSASTYAVTLSGSATSTTDPSGEIVTISAKDKYQQSAADVNWKLIIANRPVVTPTDLHLTAGVPVADQTIATIDGQGFALDHTLALNPTDLHGLISQINYDDEQHLATITISGTPASFKATPLVISKISTNAGQITAPDASSGNIDAAPDIQMKDTHTFIVHEENPSYTIASVTGSFADPQKQITLSGDLHGLLSTIQQTTANHYDVILSGTPISITAGDNITLTVKDDDAQTQTQNWIVKIGSRPIVQTIATPPVFIIGEAISADTKLGTTCAGDTTDTAATFKTLPTIQDAQITGVSLSLKQATSNPECKDIVANGTPTAATDPSSDQIAIKDGINNDGIGFNPNPQYVSYQVIAKSIPTPVAQTPGPINVYQGTSSALLDKNAYFDTNNGGPMTFTLEDGPANIILVNNNESQFSVQLPTDKVISQGSYTLTISAKNNVGKSTHNAQVTLSVQSNTLRCPEPNAIIDPNTHQTKNAIVVQDDAGNSHTFIASYPAFPIDSGYPISFNHALITDPPVTWSGIDCEYNVHSTWWTQASYINKDNTSISTFTNGQKSGGVIQCTSSTTNDCAVHLYGK